MLEHHYSYELNEYLGSDNLKAIWISAGMKVGRKVAIQVRKGQGYIYNFASIVTVKTLFMVLYEIRASD